MLRRWFLAGPQATLALAVAAALLVSSVASANAADSFPQNTPSAQFGTPSGPTGRWYSANHAIVVQIAPCGSNLCGQIVGINLAHPGDPMPNNWLGHPQCGMTIIQTTQTPTPASPPHWTGTVTDPRNGNTYHATIALDPSRHLLLHGYLGLPIFGLTQTWDPYPGRTLAHCQLAANATPGQG